MCDKVIYIYIYHILINLIFFFSNEFSWVLYLDKNINQFHLSECVTRLGLKQIKTFPPTEEHVRWRGGRRPTGCWSPSVSSSSCLGPLSTSLTSSLIYLSHLKTMKRTLKWCWCSLPVATFPRWAQFALTPSCTDSSMKTSSKVCTH